LQKNGSFYSQVVRHFDFARNCFAQVLLSEGFSLPGLKYLTQINGAFRVHTTRAARAAKYFYICHLRLGIRQDPRVVADKKGSP